jgi:predicted dehydrogenase
MPGLVPGIHVLLTREEDVDGRDKRGHDEEEQARKIRMLNAAMIGLGWWGKELVRSQRNSKLMRFTHGVTLEPDSVRDFAAEMKLTVGTCYENMLADKSIDCVVLATPHTLHRRQVEAAAAAGKHVFCEKPFALTLDDAKAMIAVCRKAGVALGVGHNRRLWPSMVKLKEIVSSKEFGTVMFAEGNYSHDILANTPLDNWRSAPQETKAGGMTGMGIHLLDGLSFLVGEMSRVSALSTKRVLPFESGDTTQAMLAFKNGATATIATSLKTPGFVWRLAVYGSDMWVESLSETKVTICRKDGKPETFDVPQQNHIGGNLDSFATAALKQGNYQIDDAGILHTVAALEAVFDSAERNGEWRKIA